MASDRKSEEKETAADAAAKTHKKAQANAAQLQKAVASLIYQAELEMEERKTLVNYDDKAIPPVPAPRKHNDPAVIHPVAAYGYAAQGGFKELVDNLRTVANEIKSTMRDPEEKKNQNMIDPNEESKSAVEFNKLFADFERDVKDTQNGWMMGQPVEPDALLSKVSKLQKDLAEYEGDKGEEKNVDQEKLKRIQAQLADFSPNVNRAIDDWQRRVQERVHSNASVIIHRKMLDAEVKNAQVSDLKKEQGGCDFLKLPRADIEALKDLKDYKSAFDRLPLNQGSTRAYILVDNPDKVVYVNKMTKEIKEMDRTPELNQALTAGDNNWKVTRSAKALAFRRPLATPGLTALDPPNGGPPSQCGAVLTSYQEKLIAEKIEHKPDWKNKLPCAFGDYSELERRSIEEREYQAKYGEPEGEKMARDKAMERLEEHKDHQMEYDVGGEKFRIQRIKDDKDKERMIFSITYLGDKSVYKRNPEAMAEMVKLANKYDPLSTIELNCEPLDHSMKRVAHSSAKDIEEQILHAVDQAEALRNGTPPVYVGLELSQNVKAALGHINSNKNLVARAESLYTSWEQHIEQKEKEKQDTATERYTAGKEGGLVAFLERKPGQLDQKVNGVGYEVDVKELNKKFKAQGDEAEDKGKRLDELKAEVLKLNMRVKQLNIASQSITDQIEALGKELKKPEAKPKLAEIATQLEGLKAAQEAVNQELIKIAGPPGQDNKHFDMKGGDQGGIAGNYSRQIGGTAMQASVVVDFTVDSKELKAYNKCIEDVGKAGKTAAKIYTGNLSTNVTNMDALKKDIEGLQSQATQKALQDAKDAKDAADNQQPQQVRRPSVT